MKKRILISGFLILLFLGALGAISGVALVFWASRDLPSYTQVSDYRPPQVTTVYAADGSILGYFYDEKRFLVTLAEMPPYLPKAFLAVEDASFYQHDGINPKAIIRAFITNMQAGTTVEGGSTITQQLVKRLLLTSEKSYVRKLKEAILAYRLERYLSKDDILNMYLNQIFFGHSSYGVEAAARTYFAKHVSELTLAESAVLAGLPQAPSRTNPYADPQATRDRQRHVLRRMLTENFITQEEHDAALEEVLVYRSMPDPSWKLGAWYLEEVRRMLIDFLKEENVRDLALPLERYGRDALYNAGLNIYTAMKPFHQHAAETALREGLYNTSKRHGWQGPVEHLEPEQYEDFFSKNVFVPQDLDNAGWVKALVTSVSGRDAKVRMGSFTGVIAAKQMEWARAPNPALAPEDSGQIRTPNQILQVGDVVWVSAVGSTGDANPLGAPASLPGTPADQIIAPYDSKSVNFDKPIPLALEQIPAVSGALISEETESGDVVALAGGYEYNYNDQYNRATQAVRQPGSAFKPVVYSAAIDNGFTAASMIDDSPFVGDRGTDENPSTWRPSNFDGNFRGPTLLRTALAQSKNLCTIRVAHAMGIQPILDRAREMGIEDNIPRDLSISLGSHAVTPLVITEVYSAFATGGQRVKPRLVHRIEDSWGHTIVTFAPEKIDAITPQNAYIMSTMLKDVIKSGSGFRAKYLKRPIAGKTGTSNEERDAWFVGFSPFLVTTVYTGYDTPKPMGKWETGSRVAVPTFAKYREKIEMEYPDEDFTMPPGVKLVSIDPENGFLAGVLTENAFELPFLTGTEPTAVSGAPRRRGDDDVRGAEEIFQQ